MCCLSCTQFSFVDTVTYYRVPANSESCADYSDNLLVQLQQVRRRSRTGSREQYETAALCSATAVERQGGS